MESWPFLFFFALMGLKALALWVLFFSLIFVCFGVWDLSCFFTPSASMKGGRLVGLTYFPRRDNWDFY